MKERFALFLAVAIVAISGRPVAADLIGTTVTGTNTYTGFVARIYEAIGQRGFHDHNRNPGSISL